MNRTTALAPVLLIAAGVALAGCTAAPDTAGPPSADTITVVASTTVYGDLAATIGGDAVEVTSIIDDPNKDPHEYEASAQNQLALSNAQVVIENGGGYDDFVDTMLDSAGNDSATVLDAVDISGKTAEDGEELNEHVWYDFPTMLLVIDEIESAFARLDPDHAETFADNADALQADIEELIQREADLNAQYAGAGVAISEPVPLYLLEAVGLVNKTPDAFSEAIEEGSDVPPSVLLETLELFTGGEVELLAYNEQTTGPQTEQILEAANENDIAVVPVTETLPDGDTYVSWMSGNLDAIATALGS
ncbi:zinc ABC transporter substrate-binding protein [Nocardioides rotundus]|uniref:metal ABC transporter solute-binding protein, Zn/Mn family n=1 Tax=Nocardioides rotundus TaxID=1774216 RepID=UPI001CBF1CB8|nr:zinc ABC transporter substrate-binding protein [Nocardioides rotundus]UAL29784.1 zinc ABC transporter substrate-binding protein [Nocardioides rotundus]